MKYSFFAIISRLRNISRWTLMRNMLPENVQEHSHMVAVIAHALAIIRKDVYGLDADPGKEVINALFHDASEIFTGDLPTPVKYFDPDIKTAYKRVESVASTKLLSTLPKELRASYTEILTPLNKNETNGVYSEDSYSIVKAADKLAAYIKCLEELKSGNQEFKLAAKQSRVKLDALKSPEVDYFIKHFIPAFELTLDELDFSME